MYLTTVKFNIAEEGKKIKMSVTYASRRDWLRMRNIMKRNPMGGVSRLSSHATATEAEASNNKSL
jgi:hypothetical protein